VNVTADGLRVDGERVVFRSENHPRIKQAFTRSESPAELAAEIHGQKIQILIQRCKGIAATDE
jgi:hypothetical protein